MIRIPASLNKEYLVRKQFYNLPVELNTMIEEIIAAAYTTSAQQTIYKGLNDNDKKRIALNTEMTGIQELKEKEIKNY
nr:15759_t:CDS:2 [Entrophospora candida]